MIDKKKALEIADSRIFDTERYELKAVWGDNVRRGLLIYGERDWSNTWAVFVSRKSQGNILNSSYVVVIQRETEEVIYQGYINDEG